MLYQGKRPEEMTDAELEAAAVYCNQRMIEAHQIAELNKAGLVELGLEYERRLERKASLN